MSNSKPSLKVCWNPTLIYVYIQPSKLQLCLYPHLSNHFMANSKPSILCFFGLFFLRKLCLFPKVFFQPSIYVYFHMAISKLSCFRQLWPFPYAVLHRPGTARCANVRRRCPRASSKTADANLNCNFLH